jgi:hypothetical protein
MATANLKFIPGVPEYLAGNIFTMSIWDTWYHLGPITVLAISLTGPRSQTGALVAVLSSKWLARGFFVLQLQSDLSGSAANRQTRGAG